MSDAHNLVNDTPLSCGEKKKKNNAEKAENTELDLSHEFVEEFLTNDSEEEYYLQEEYVEAINDVYEFPLFDGKANMTARMRLPSKRFDIWAEVSAVCGNGTLVSASGTKDRLWLGFVEQKAILHWNAGSGPMGLSSGTVKTDGRTKLSARRYKKDAMLKLGSTITRGTSHGRMSSLDVDPFVYVGYSPRNVTRLIGFSLPGFVGCIHRLRIDGRDVIPPSKGLSITSQGLRSCTPHNLAQLVCP